MPVTKTQAIKNFLLEATHFDLASLYSHDMECQVNVAQENGERIEGTFKGRRWHGWSDGTQTWKSFRIPYGAAKEPSFDDKNMSFPIDRFAEGIGMTGWDWVAKRSRWVGFDFDAIVGHSENHTKKLTDEELQAVRDAATAIPWVTVRHSTSGTGLHLYIFIDVDVEVKNHTEHSALARSILGTMSAIAGFNFLSKVDACGGNMWVWHRKMLGNSDGLKLVKKGVPLTELPKNWREHVKAVTKSRRKNLPQDTDPVSGMAAQRSRTPLGPEHKRLIAWLQEKKALWWWDQDLHMLVTHTGWLKQAHEDLVLAGLFETNSDSTNLDEQNCFAFPLRDGAWSVRRYSPGCQEHDAWSQDSNGWTRTFLNRVPDLSTLAKMFGGVERPEGGFLFSRGDAAQEAVHHIGISLSLPASQLAKDTVLKQHKDGRIIVEVERGDTDKPDEMSGWYSKKNKPWAKIFDANIQRAEEFDTSSFDDTIRSLISSSESLGWVVSIDGQWCSQPFAHIKEILKSEGVGIKELSHILGNQILRSFRVVNRPFQPEYPGDREWNRNAAKLRFLPKEEGAKFPTWTKILDHTGSGLDMAVAEDAWCRSNGVKTGGEYLLCWVASLFQKPLEPLPYLFFYSEEQNTGKSILHEALSLLMTSGYQKADLALESESGFNGELEGAVLCVVEEVDLGKNKKAYNRIKDWVTSPTLNIRHLYRTPYHIQNSTHWIQCANSYDSVPVFTGDTRIVMSYVRPLSTLEMVPKRQMMVKLEKEAPDFITAVLGLELPETNDRLNIPVIETAEKSAVQDQNKSTMELFLSEHCVKCLGSKIKFSDVYNRFQEWADPQDLTKWTKIYFGRNLPPHFPKGRIKSNNQLHLGNIAWLHDPQETSAPYRLDSEKEYLVRSKP